ERGLQPLLLTFDPHPRSIVRPSQAPRKILTSHEELETLQEAFAGDILVMDFDENVRDMSADRFVRDVLIRTLGMRVLVSGENNTLGKDRQGDAAYLRQHARDHGYEYVVVPAVTDDGETVSSSAIRRYIARGEIEAANRLLLYPYRISGKVIRGLGLGRKLGYPTANIAIHPNKALPREGVYAATVTVGDERFGAMMFVGRNHMDPVESFSVEGNILNFERDIYGERITYWPISFVRENRRFQSQEALIEQIGKDKLVIEEILRKKEPTSVN
ncbi:MAG TPA: riboflavin biosynthesis protein RibF, partial [candidate division Zixibacteria bacterium]|nr:riboflavin biosynthesis protein RibF [candidate division Zixibacteria bacterium]